MTGRAGSRISNWIRVSHEGVSPLPKLPTCIGIESAYLAPGRNHWEREKPKVALDYDDAEEVEKIYMALPLDRRLLVRDYYFGEKSRFDQTLALGTKEAVAEFRGKVNG